MLGERHGAAAVALIACAVACGGEERRGTPGTGGTAPDGSVEASGGRPSSGGRPGTGARPATGGAPSGSGGATDGGSAPSTGGQSSSGGASQTCDSDSECLGGEYCIGTSETIECVPGECKLDAECPDGTYCYRARCVPPRVAAKNCDWEVRCGAGLLCILGVCSPPLPPDARCDLACEGQRICVTDGSGRPFCVEPAITCPNDELCSYADYCGEVPAEGGLSCRPRGGLRAACRADRECGIGLACAPTGCAPRGFGTLCTDDSDCPEEMHCFSDGSSESPICIARILPYEPCGGAAGSESRTSCVRGFLCNEQTWRCEPLDAPPCAAPCPSGQRCEKTITNGRCSLLPH